MLLFLFVEQAALEAGLGKLPMAFFLPANLIRAGVPECLLHARVPCRLRVVSCSDVMLTCRRVLRSPFGF